MEEGKLTLDPENSGFGGINPLETVGEVGSVGGELGPIDSGGWVELIESLDSPRLTEGQTKSKSSQNNTFHSFILNLSFSATLATLTKFDL